MIFYLFDKYLYLISICIKNVLHSKKTHNYIILLLTSLNMSIDYICAISVIYII